MSRGRDTLVIATGHELSLALLEGERLVAERHMAVAAGHAEALLPAIADLLGNPAGSRVSRILVETGPGSFTGLRVGLAAARALAIAFSAELFGVASAAFIAAEASARGAIAPLLVALAAPRGQIWLGEAGTQPASELGMRSLWPEDARPIAQAWIASGGVVTGSGAPALVETQAGPERAPRAAAAALLPPSSLGPPRALYVSAERRPAPARGSV
jgi:tRNA threonylcarbamoyladenosine biosynthesis protein TsaB